MLRSACLKQFGKRLAAKSFKKLIINLIQVPQYFTCSYYACLNSYFKLICHENKKSDRSSLSLRTLSQLAMRLINHRRNFSQQSLNSNQSAKQHQSILLNMSHQSNSAQNEPPLANDSVERSPKIFLDIVKFATNPYVKLSIFLSLGVTVLLPGFNRAVQANNSTHLSSSTQNHGWRSQSKDSNNHSQKLILAKTTAKPTVKMVKSPPHIYLVQQGDTISKIAKKYQVSNDDLVSINQIGDSNIIFVNQRLKIPVSQISADKIKSHDKPTANNVSDPLDPRQKAAASSSMVNRNQANSAKLDEDSYITKLRAENRLVTRSKSAKTKNQRCSSQFQ